MYDHHYNHSVAKSSFIPLSIDGERSCWCFGGLLEYPPIDCCYNLNLKHAVDKNLPAVAGGGRGGHPGRRIRKRDQIAAAGLLCLLWRRKPCPLGQNQVV